jgi:hypothetical protein
LDHLSEIFAIKHDLKPLYDRIEVLETKPCALEPRLQVVEETSVGHDKRITALENDLKSLKDSLAAASQDTSG